MQKIDIRIIKEKLREDAKSYRRSLPADVKAQLDREIYSRLFEIGDVAEAKTVLCYLSTNIEVDTYTPVSAFLSQGKCVAVPKCIDGTRDMDFYCISSFEQTEKCTFGVYEPIVSQCEKLRDFRSSVCIIPGLVFDLQGFRLGYGKGYYDRFLSKYRGLKIGICYENCIGEQLPHGFFDVAADVIVTEKRTIYI